MKNNKFLILVGTLEVVLVFGFLLAGCATDTSTTVNDVDPNEYVFADVRSYYENPDVASWDNNGRKASEFQFYKSVSYDITDLNAVKAYLDSLPKDKTVYNRYGSETRRWYDDSHLYFALQLHENTDGPTSFDIWVYYPDPDKENMVAEGLMNVAREKVLEIIQGMVNRVKP
jgi:hypothetical protein